ncbi:E1-E2 ATPase-domain-containing protein [Blyttiomyces helicus]|uniref:E1-E2 ATPase-domain-containing protein n=1 Tax=Blyttiomyces helicus TaxID=388810 RepID=A0A4P9VTZ3_9FUNG|nr:E1-E2 ATPase-domain-containing protein [Blyttiomyces helicus]|eukprot:RKO83014.1 E1-E2 ATPase-domain-containing protein [Blyttiomyces helicus]
MDIEKQASKSSVEADLKSPDKPARRDSEPGIAIQYRTLSLHVDRPATNKKKRGNGKVDPTEDISDINVHLLRVEDVFTRYSTHPTLGLESAALERKRNDPKNIISPPPAQYWRKIVTYLFGGFNFLMWIAFIVTILSYKPLGEPNPQILNLGVAILLIAVIIISATFYALVDFNASKIMASIRGLVAEEAIVIRNGVKQEIKAEDVTVGDLVVLSLGQRVPADLRLVEVSSDLKFDRALLTGERLVGRDSDASPFPTVVRFFEMV